MLDATEFPLCAHLNIARVECPCGFKRWICVSTGRKKYSLLRTAFCDGLMCSITLYVFLGDLLTVNTASDGQIASIRQLHARERAIGDMQLAAMVAPVMV